LEEMINAVKRTGHSSFYVEQGMSALGKSTMLGISGAPFPVNGGAFPIWVENVPCCPIAVVACYSGSSQEDHTLVASTVRDYLTKLRRNSETPVPSMQEQPVPVVPREESKEWLPHPQGPSELEREPEYFFNNDEQNKGRIG